MNTTYQLRKGQTPLLVSIPHAGTQLTEDCLQDLEPYALSLADTDWHLPQLYNFLDELDVSVIQADYSRYVVDLNRLADGQSLYPGQSVTEICPTTDFEMRPLYKEGDAPDDQKIAGRVESFWKPYHEALQCELQRIQKQFGFALLWDAHSIRSRVPRFFSGQLPDFNFGNADESSCDSALTQQLCDLAQKSQYSHVLNGRFKGGAITRTYGRPTQGVHAVQLELSQITYMDEDTFTFNEEKANQVRPVLHQFLKTMLSWRPS